MREKIITLFHDGTWSDRDPIGKEYYNCEFAVSIEDYSKAKAELTALRVILKILETQNEMLTKKLLEADGDIG